jgi:hypothetical protein
MVIVFPSFPPGLQLWNSDHGHVVEACKDSLKKLQLDYLDLYLVHFPVATRHTGACFYSLLFCLVIIYIYVHQSMPFGWISNSYYQCSSII